MGYDDGVGVDEAGDGRFERRGGLRERASLKVQYTSIGELVEAYTVDISRGGLFVKTQEPLPIGEVVKIHAELPDGGPSLDTFGRVAHVIGAEALADGRVPGMGLEFLDTGKTPMADDVARFLAATGYADPVPDPPAGITGRVLVIDDEESARERAASAIRNAGHTVTTAKNGMDGLRKALADPPDLIVSDIQMPALDGWQLLRLIRARGELAHVPVVFVTSSITDDERLKGYQIGVSDYVAKPYDDDELALQIQRVLERCQAYPGSTARTCALSGQLAHVSIGRVLSLLAAEQRHGRLMLVNRLDIATAYLRDGRVVRVDVPDEHDDKTGAERLFWLLDWVDGRFEFTVGDIEGDDVVEMDTAQAMIQHAHLHQEEPTTP
jgi:uncharacterized protein (TIGR02266 family)